jgi:hypothetical protein
MSVVLGPRDLHVLTDIGEHGCLDTIHIHQRHFASVTLRRCQQRLQDFQRAGLICSTKLHVTFSSDAQSGVATATTKRIPTLHALTDKGGDAFADTTGIRPLRILRSEPQPATFLHRWQCVQTRLAFDASTNAAGLTPALWLLESDVDPKAKKNLPPNQRSILHHTFSDGISSIACQPDMVCLLIIPPDTSLVAFFEQDRSTMGSKQIAAKARRHQSLVESRAYTRYWPALKKPVVRVFWIAPSDERIQTIVQASEQQPVQRSYRFLTERRRDAGNRILDPVWAFPDGRMAPIYSP